MGIVVCLAMLLGLIMLRPSPWNGEHRVNFNSRFRQVVWVLLAVLGAWNTLYGLFKVDDFWFFMSVISGIAMMLSAAMIASERDSTEAHARTPVQNSIVFIMALSFLVYAVTLIQLNLGYTILR